MENLKNRKTICTILVWIFVLINFAWYGLVWNNTHISEVNLNQYKIYENDSDGYLMFLDKVICDKDEISVTKDYIVIDGWVINQNISFDRITINLILVNTSTSEAYKIPTTMVERKDVSEEYGNNYDWSGFSVKIPYTPRIDPEKYDYNIMSLIKINDDDVVIIDSGKDTGEYR